jgi:hypothetical protein
VSLPSKTLSSTIIFSGNNEHDVSAVLVIHIAERRTSACTEEAFLSTGHGSIKWLRNSGPAMMYEVSIWLKGTQKNQHF